MKFSLMPGEGKRKSINASGEKKEKVQFKTERKVFILKSLAPSLLVQSEKNVKLVRFYIHYAIKQF